MQCAMLCYICYPSCEINFRYGNTLAVDIVYFSGISPACQIHEYHGTFIGQAVKFKMTSVCGHVMSLDFKSMYNNWDAVEPVSFCYHT